MNTNLPTVCYNCSTPLPFAGYFCGSCLVQFKCKSCDTILEKDYIGCVNCGTPKLSVEKHTTLQQNVNTFRLHETATERSIEATFSDDVAKDIASTLRDAAATNRIKTITTNIPSPDDLSEKTEDIVQFAEAEIMSGENQFLNTETSYNPLSTNNPVKPENYLTLKAIAMKKLPSTELEWILVYAFYASNYGKETFTRQNLIEKYEESNRLDNSKKSTLSIYITRAVKANLINPLADEYSILDDGIEKAVEIIHRTTSSPSKTKRSVKTKGENPTVNKSNKTSNSVKSYKRLTDINFYPSDNKSLVDFIKDYKIKNDNERNLIFTYYLSEVLKITSIKLDHLYTCYDEINQKIPENMSQSLGNTKTRTGWLKTNNSNIEITTKGINKIKHWNKKE